MSMDFHTDPVLREQFIVSYLERRMVPVLSEEWENHYLGCTDCFEEMRATQLLMRCLGEPGLREEVGAGKVQRQRINDVTVLKFVPGSQLLAASLELAELKEVIRLESDTKVLIDLSRVSRIDSTGLGILMQCHCHAVKNAGALKLLHPDAPVRRVLSVTKIDSVLQTFDDERAAIESFSRS
ncbi:MAG TPA: STAS domain-containing protein [Bryobacteraceae bacterium]|nr:STAS domain-containing protein [Bryobacteraceae bacterium]